MQITRESLEYGMRSTMENFTPEPISDIINKVLGILQQPPNPGGAAQIQMMFKEVWRWNQFMTYYHLWQLMDYEEKRVTSSEGHS